MREGNAPEAIAQFEQALRLHPDFPEAEENLRLAKAGDPQFPSQSPPVEFWSVRAQRDSRLMLTVAGIGDPGFGGAAGKGNPIGNDGWARRWMLGARASRRCLI